MLLTRRFLCLYGFYALIVLVQVSVTVSGCQKNSDCTFGYCQAGHCICNEGWWGNLCEFCRLRYVVGMVNRIIIWFASAFSVIDADKPHL